MASEENLQEEVIRSEGKKDPCSNCDETDTTCCEPCPHPDPVMPRCDIALLPGVFTNATVKVNENGCIEEVQEGKPFVYAPDPCCLPVDTGGGGDGGTEGPPGPPGQNATIEVGAVTTVEAGEAADVVNEGSETHAVLHFYIPRGASGESGTPHEGVDYSAAGLEIEKGIVTGVPINFPPISMISAVNQSGLMLEVKKDSEVGAAVLTISANQLITNLQSYADERVNTAAKQLDDKINQSVSALRELIKDLDERVKKLEKAKSN